MLRVEDIDQMIRIGKILSNYNKSKLLVELRKGPLPKSKIKEILGVSSGSTVTAYVSELLDEGLVKEQAMIKDGKYLIHLVKISVDGLIMDFSKIKENKGWKHDQFSTEGIDE